MSLNLSAPETTELQPRILVFGVGGAGGNAVNNMIESQLEGVDFVVANTDAQCLRRAKTERRIQMGAGITEGLGAGARPEVGAQAAEDSLQEIIEHLTGAHMVFITAGMGGGTGTGAAPVIARAARDQGVLTVGVVTKPFHFEGARRMRIAEAGIEALQAHVDTLIIIPNQNLFRIATEKTTFAEAFSMADQVLHSGVRGVTDLMVMPGLINLDFADVRTVMNEMGKAMMGTGESSGDKRAVEAAQAAINNPLLDDVSMKGARGVLINITGGMDMTLYEVDEAANEIRNEVDPEANIIVGSTFDEALDGKVRVSVVATGIDGEPAEARDPRRIEPRTEARSAWRSREPQREPAPFVRRAGESEGPAAPRAAPTSEPVRPAVRATESRVEPVRPQSNPVAEKPEVVRAQERLAAAAEDLRRAQAEPDADAGLCEDEDRRASRATSVMETAELEERSPSQAAPEAQAAPGPGAGHSAPAIAAALQEEARPRFSLFGRRQKAPARSAADPGASAPVYRNGPAARSEPAAEPGQTRAPSAASTGRNGDLFGDTFDESELEIPAFLRRQTN